MIVYYLWAPCLLFRTENGFTLNENMFRKINWMFRSAQYIIISPVLIGYLILRLWFRRNLLKRNADVVLDSDKAFHKSICNDTSRFSYGCGLHLTFTEMLHKYWLMKPGNFCKAFSTWSSFLELFQLTNPLFSVRVLKKFLPSLMFKNEWSCKIWLLRWGILELVMLCSYVLQ